MKVSLRGGFSDRNLIKEISKEIQYNSLNQRTRIKISNEISKYAHFICERVYDIKKLSEISMVILDKLYSQKINHFECYYLENVVTHVCNTILKDDYDDALTAVEFVSTIFHLALRNYGITYDSQIYEKINDIFKDEFVGYRFVDEKIVQITNETEIAAIEEALSQKNDKVKEFLQKAINFISISGGKDYANSIKESITAVEALCKLIVGNDSGTLGGALKIIEKKKSIHPAFKEALLKLYGFTSDESGIRHGGNVVKTDLGFEDAKFILVTCSAFINYMIDIIGE